MPNFLSALFSPIPFGGTVHWETLYAGYHLDEETELYQVRNRYLHSTTGIWLIRDPIGFAGGDLNLYRYCRGNPVTATDPSGKDCPGCDIPDWALGLKQAKPVELCGCFSWPRRRVPPAADVRGRGGGLQWCRRASAWAFWGWAWRRTGASELRLLDVFLSNAGKSANETTHAATDSNLTSGRSIALLFARSDTATVSRRCGTS
jgi:RHS repeat-associated protein